MSTDVRSLAVDPASLPNDVQFLKGLVVQLLEELRKRDGRTAQLEHHMDLLLKRIYGRSSEKLDPRQLALFQTEEAAAEGPADATAAQHKPGPAQEVSAGPAPKADSKHGRRKLPDTLKRVELIHDLTDAEKAALGGVEQLLAIGREVTEQLEWKPSCLFVIRHVQLKYARREQLLESGATLAEKNVIVASKPPQPIRGGLAGPGLLAQVIVSKYGDHLPLHRLEGIFERHGLCLARQTTCDWVLACAELLRPLYDLMVREVLASRVLHTDDTPVKVRDAHRKEQYTGRFWTYVGDAEHPLTVFDYTPSRTRDGPQQFLRDCRGYLQADAFSGYDGIYLGSQGAIVEVACWAHARRKFDEAKQRDEAHAQVALVRIGQLYAVERALRRRCAEEWRELPAEERYARIAAVRQEQSRPLLDLFHEWLLAEAPKLTPKDPMRQAMDYTLGNWEALCRYCEHGALDIDNNEAERALRGIAVGRNNWLFCGSDRGGRAAAVHFSLLASCRRHKVNAFCYLRDALDRLPALALAAPGDALTAAADSRRPSAALSDADLRALLPHLWQPA